MGTPRNASTTGPAFARLRDEICLRAGLAPGVIAVVSARRGEGRTSVAVGLAQAFGRITRAPVLLVDLDLARPALHHLLGVPAAPGVSDILRGDCDVADVVRRVGDGGVSLLPAGSRSEDAGAFVASERMSELMAALRSQAEAIIIDAPPVESGVQASLIAAAADAALLVVRAEQTTERDARSAYDALATVRGTNLLGVVLSAVRRGRAEVATDRLGKPARIPLKATAERVPQGSESPSD